MQGFTSSSPLRSRLYVDGFGEAEFLLAPDFIRCCRYDSSHFSDGPPASCLGFTAGSQFPSEILLSEVFAAYIIGKRSVHEARPTSSNCCLRGQRLEMHCFVVHFVEKSYDLKPAWVPKTLIFSHSDLNTCEEWVQRIRNFLDNDKKRPKKLLVFVNPMSGKGQGPKTWQTVAPYFALAKIHAKVVKTQRAGHAYQIMKEITDDELGCLDGVVAVGGDGFFNEVLNGLLSLRHKAALPPSPEDVKEQVENGNTPFCGRESSEDKSALSDSRRAKSIDENSQSNTDSSPSCYDSHLFLENDPSKSERLPVSSNQMPKSENNGSHFKRFRTMEQPCHSPRMNMEPEQELSHKGTSSRNTQTEQSICFSFPHPSFRFGIIPAGSTDTIVMSTTGARDPVTSAFQIILGTRIPLDIAQVVSWQGSSRSLDAEPQIRYAASFAGYGFYGDVIKESELCRWMGPSRYDILGTKVFLRHRAYEAEIAFIKIPNEIDRSRIGGNASDRKCISNCSYCANSVSSERTSLPQGNIQNETWLKAKGLFLSVGAAVMSCRNDKAPDGLVANAHLADGFLHLILIKECSHASYLRHLVRLTKRGSDPLDFEFVEHQKTPAFTFVSHGAESVWNVDGELFQGHKLSAQAFRGLISLFAAGPEF